jgi:serine/threonine protein kinase/tetratricopeptide (TPR) repeat protein
MKPFGQMTDSFKQCPQCLHRNPMNAPICELCDWSMGDETTEETHCPNPSKNSPASDVTIAPDHLNKPTTTDPNLTVAPSNLMAKSIKSEEQRTFHLAGDLAHFEIIEILGQGGMGAVYHAKDLTLHRDVALKMMRSGHVASQVKTAALLDEARMASKLNHPNIVTIYDVARTDNSNYIVMEWVDGQSMDQVIPATGLALTEALNYACQIADGLVAAHQKYLIHRDIKPQNIMLTKDNTIKILDFGIAGLVSRISESSQNNHQEPMNPTVIGTPSYMSPEQAKGLNLDQRSDIFSFGIVLYQMLSGARPFTAGQSKSVTEVICQGEYTPIQNRQPDTPPRVVHLLDKMLAVQLDERWQSSALLAAELHDIYQEITHVKNWWQRRHWLTQALLLLPFVVALGWAVKEVMFPATTQQLIERQLAEAQKIAILPLENISGDPLIQIYGDGLAVNLGTDLATVAAELGNTWIVPSTEISRMKEPSLQAVTDKYGVNLVLSGSIQHLGSTHLMVLNLMDGQTGQQLKTSEIEIQANQLFEGQNLIRNAAMGLLDWHIPDELSEKFAAERPKLDGAYKEYIQGRGYLYQYDQANNLDKALLSFQQAIELDHRYENAYIGLAETQLNRFTESKEINWLHDMIDSIEALKTINPNNSLISYLTAEAASSQGEYQKAVDMYQASIEQNPMLMDAHIGMANAYNKLGDSEAAEAVYLKARKAAPNNWNVIVNLGVFYTRIGDYEQALEQFQTMMEVSPRNHIGYRNAAGIHYILGDIEAAIQLSKQAIEIRPTVQAYSNIGTMLFAIGNYEEAVGYYLKALEFNDQHYIYWGNLADAYKLSGNTTEAKHAFGKAVETANDALEINPKDTSSLAHMAYYLANLDRKSEAIVYAEQITQSSPGLENFVVATAYDHLQEVDKSLAHIQWALAKNYPLDEVMNTPLLTNSRKHPKFEQSISQE